MKKTSILILILSLRLINVFSQSVLITPSTNNTLNVKGNSFLQGKVGINTTSTGSFGSDLIYPRIESVSESSDTSDVNLILFENSGNGALLNFAKARGTRNSPAKVNFGDTIFGVFGYAHDGSQFYWTGGLDLLVDKTSGTSNIPTALRFFTTSEGSVSSTERMRISSKGNVGIGSTDPTQAKLVVNGNVNSTVGNFSYLQLNTPLTGFNSTGNSYNYSIYATNRIAASEFNAFSDARIKDIKGISNNEKDLEMLSKIEITDYQFKDKFGKGNGQYKKVIAQQVESVYPQAVSMLTDCIPDIYQLSKIENNFIALPNHNLKVGEKVKLIFDTTQELVEVKEINEKGFQIINPKSQITNQQVFVYGREVSDFRSVDYEALSTLNISATQALLKRLNEAENRINKLEKIQNEILQQIGQLSALDK